MADIKCKWLDEELEICLNGDCPVCADFCPLSEYKGVCRYEECEDDEYEDYLNIEDRLEFIWGIKACDDLSVGEANMYTMNDIDIIYDKKNEIFILGVETAYVFKNKTDEVKYLNNLFEELTKFMESGGYDMNVEYDLWMSQPGIDLKAKTISELYTQFRIFVEGYKALYGVRDNEAS